MTWYYERDSENERFRLRFEDDAGYVYGPQDVAWAGAPSTTSSADGWIVSPDLKAEAGKAATNLYTDVSLEVAMMALRDLAASRVKEGNPSA